MSLDQLITFKLITIKNLICISERTAQKKAYFVVQMSTVAMATMAMTTAGTTVTAIIQPFEFAVG